MVEPAHPQPGDREEERGSAALGWKVEVGDRPAGVRRVLMLCYYFPPVASAGTYRTVGFTRWLQEYGWHPLVLTVRRSRTRWERRGEQAPAGVDVVRSFEWDLQRLLAVLTGMSNRVFDFLKRPRPPSIFYTWCLPDPQVAWFTTIQGARLARSCDCIYASCSPFSSALSGCLIKLLTGRPLVLDFRDPWAFNPHANRSPIQERVLRWLEKQVVGTCDELILNTPGTERLYRTAYPEHAHKMTCIPNGFDCVNVPTGRTSGDRFVITHVGDFYRSRRPDRLLEALVAIGNPQIEFVQVGPVFESYARFKDKLPIRIIDGVPHEQALELMRAASMLYLCQGWEAGVTANVQVASKTYEYLATGLPILGECPPGDNVELVRRYAKRAWLVTPPDVDGLKRSITEAYDSRDQHRPEISAAFMRTFDRRRLTGDLAAVLDSAAGGAIDRPPYPAPGPVRSVQRRRVVEPTCD